MTDELRRKTGRGRPILYAELRINPLEMFSDGCWRNSEDHAGLGIRFSARYTAPDFRKKLVNQEAPPNRDLVRLDTD